ncbi:MAG: 16S rRNA (adenine(1518)-N(6)/adenine(1519)-N(6))-dimethyltransferase RsmA [Gammaproteobacteria bacterium]|nr:16S rRNA (adenine(1518)-N(6)/adenine(1519)-N(6))-dimethyltransferase RsmA [Gammaproteobacteria bacterium]TVQ49343.1 MAG: 16S rRNA (adenine(1518)-N(6)/adenine(1519)-N(6))-dimethyltransferase RsmA [Gammaproteobacteria bacterium]
MNHRPRKRFGQHFLHDRAVIARIVAAIDPQPGEQLLEIGPGLGALTEPLLARCGRLQAVELDRDVIGPLRERCAGVGELLVHAGDALAVDLATLAGDARLRLVGNLPYNISTPLLFHLLRQRQYIHDMHFMLQKEVVMRMTAAPGGRDYGRLTVMLGWACEAVRLFDIGPGAFTPPPRVWSSIVRLRPRCAPLGPAVEEARLRTLVTAAFGQRRKTLRNALRAHLDAEAIQRCGIDPGSRPERLEIEDFVRLAALDTVNSTT